MLVRFGINLIFLVLLAVFAIRPGKTQREYMFTVVMLNVIVFFICFTMKKLELDLGLALGLFAVFGVLRYRTDSLKPKEMTYLFIVIGLALINALSNKKTSYAEVLLVNSLIVGISFSKSPMSVDLETSRWLRPPKDPPIKRKRLLMTQPYQIPTRNTESSTTASNGLGIRTAKISSPI